MGLDNEPVRPTDRPDADVKREASGLVAQRRAAEESSQPPPSNDESERDAGTVTTPHDERTGITATAQIRTRDLEQALDLLDGLVRILHSFHEEQRGRHEPDPLIDELVGIHGHGYNWEALRYQDRVGEGWSYIAASLEELRARLDEAHANAAD